MNPYGISPGPLDLPAIAAWNTANQRARAAYYADRNVAAGLCADGCGRRLKTDLHRLCWEHSRQRGHARRRAS